jgi:hypothetical protein
VYDDSFLASLDRLDAALDELRGHDVVALDASTLGVAFQRLETHSRRRDSMEHGLVAEIDTRRIGVEAGYRSTAGYLRGLSNIAPSDAKRRVQAAENLAPRRTLTGELLPVVFPAVAAAQADGLLSGAHARPIATCVDKLPDAVAADYDRVIERDLVEHAKVLDPRQLAAAAHRIAYLHDQDGVLADEAYREKHRALTIAQRVDGSAHIEGELTAPCAEALLTLLDSLAAPRPEADGVKDPRTAGERNHDALLDGLNRLLVDGGLPATGGIRATILLTMTEEQLGQRTLEEVEDQARHRPDPQLVRTGHGALISLAMALKIAVDAQVIPIVFRGAKEIAAYGDTHRLATRGQRLALIARDQGCSFPGCAIPPAWCQTHHVTDFQLTRRTSVDDLTLLCGYHHRIFERLGWTCEMINGFPHWTPPPWIDPDRVPRRNTAHV